MSKTLAIGSTMIAITILAVISLSSTAPVKLQTFTLSRNEAPGGVSVTGILRLSKAAPRQGAIVTIDAIDPMIASVPTTVQFNQGQSLKQFTIIGVPRCDQAQINISCTLGIALVQPLIIRQPYASITFAPNPVVGGSETTGTVTLDGPAPDCQ